MSFLSEDRSQQFVKPEASFGVKKCWLGIILTVILLLSGIVQTQRFVTLLPCPSLEEIREHIKQCRAIQANQPQETGIVFKLFDEETTKKLEATKDSLINDTELQDELQKTFGMSFRELNAVVVPSWKLISKDNNGLVGVTDDGWIEARKAIGEPDVGGITLRNKPNARKWTEDGTPRIVLNTAAFGNLRLTLFHELLHAMNVPAFYPSPVTFAQNDLTYLPQYRNFVHRAHLDYWHEPKIWFLAVGVPILILFLLFLRLRRLRQRTPQSALTNAVDATSQAD